MAAALANNSKAGVPHLADVPPLQLSAGGPYLRFHCFVMTRRLHIHQLCRFQPNGGKLKGCYHFVNHFEHLLCAANWRSRQIWISPYSSIITLGCTIKLVASLIKTYRVLNRSPFDLAFSRNGSFATYDLR